MVPITSIIAWEKKDKNNPIISHEFFGILSQRRNPPLLFVIKKPICIQTIPVSVCAASNMICDINYSPSTSKTSLKGIQWVCCNATPLTILSSTQTNGCRIATVPETSLATTSMAAPLGLSAAEMKSKPSGLTWSGR